MFKKAPECHLAKRLNPLVPLLAIALLIIALAISFSRDADLLIIWSRASYLAAAALAIYSFGFCYRYGNKQLVKIVDRSLNALDLLLIILFCGNFIFWNSGPVFDLLMILLLIQAVSNLIGTHYKEKRHLA